MTSARFRGIGALACLLAGVVALHAETPAPPDGKPKEDPLAELPADFQTKVRAFFEKVDAAKRIVFDRRMKDTTDTVVKTTGLSGDEPLKKLADAAKEAEDRSLAEWNDSAKKLIQQEYRQNPAMAMAAADQMLAMADMFAAREDPQIKFTPPDEQPAWTEALARNLSAEQAAAWSKLQESAHHVEDKETAKFLDAQADRVRDQYTVQTVARADGIAAALGLPKERGEKLDSLAKSAVEQTLKAFRKSTLKFLEGMSAEQRQSMMQQQNVYYGVQNGDEPTAQDVWKVGLATLLSDTERQRLHEIEEEHRARRARAYGEVLLALMDERTALTAAQREQLQKPAEQAVRQAKALFPDEDNTNTYFQIQRETFFGAAKSMKDEEVRPVLDAVQWQHWQDASKAADGRDNPYQQRMKRTASTPKPDAKPAETPEPEEYERAISDCLDEKTLAERKRLLGIVSLKTEDVARVAGISGPALDRLQTAARGSVEQTLAAWKSNLAQNVRSQVDNAGPENVRALLANLPDYQFRQYNPQQADKPTLWDQTAALELTPEQRAAWQRETDARTAYREGAIAQVILAEFDRRYSVSAAQEARLAPQIATAIRDYAPDINRMFSYSYEYAPWYLQSYTMFMPLAAISEHDLKDTLGKDIYDRWCGSQEFSNTTNYWQNITRYHEQRLKEAKK